MTIYVYHELQDSHLCGQHCLNNLIQQDFFSAVALADIAQELDEQERSILTPNDPYSPGKSELSSNVDESGNFSIQVLRVALERYHNIDLVPWHFNSDGADSDPLTQQGFVVNRSEHWFTIRKIKDTWWNLNSTSELPEMVSQFYLSALLHQLRQDGYSVFIAKGTLHTNTTGKPFGSDVSGDIGKWYTEDELLRKGAGSGSTPGAKPSGAATSAFNGKGNRLGGDDDVPAQVNMADFMVDGEDSEMDLQLLQAISASMAACEAPRSAAIAPSTGDAKKDAAAELRAKRLAALEKRGL
jgi:ataxin-3